MSLQKSWMIGRSRECDLVVTAVEVSSRHCRLHQTADGFLLEDLGSINGTFVNGKRITGRVAVRKTDRVTLGAKTPFPWPPSENAATPPPLPGPAPTVLSNRPTNTQVLRIGRG